MSARQLSCVLLRNVPKLKTNRTISTTTVVNQRKLNQPQSANEMPRSGGIASMMRLPIQNNAEGLDACFVGVPLDSGSSHRPGARLGPRQIRTESVIIKPFNASTGAAPFESLQVADIGDIACNIYNLPEAVKEIKQAFDEILKHDCVPLTVGGDHTITYPILQAIKEKHGPVALIQIDAHADTSDNMFGAKIAHGTAFRRAIEEDCLDCKRSIQIGLRGTGFSPFDYDWVQQQGVRIVKAHECWNKSLAPLMEEVRATIGDCPVYITFDIDGIDPCFAPGTGVPEIAGLTIIQALEIIRGCKGLNVIGADLMEVSPSYDITGNTSMLAANLLHEMLCVLPGVKYY